MKTLVLIFSLVFVVLMSEVNSQTFGVYKAQPTNSYRFNSRPPVRYLYNYPGDPLYPYRPHYRIYDVRNNFDVQYWRLR